MRSRGSEQAKAPKVFAALSLALVSACGGPEPSLPASSVEPVIYGVDGRREAYASSDIELRNRVQSAVVALIRDEELDLRRAQPADVWTAASLGASKGVCASERFAEQPSVAACTGILVEPDLVLTAGHCARSSTCAELSLVFDFFYENEGVPRDIDAEDVYRCREIVDYRLPSLVETLDYGWIRLDRAAAAAHPPLEVERSARGARLGEPLRMFDFGAGVPLKTQDGAVVVDPRSESLDYFVSDLDAFGGGSGAPVLDASGRVLGILSSGHMDFEPSADGCLVAARLDPGVAAERATYAFRAWESFAPSDDERSSSSVASDAARTPSCSVMPGLVSESGSLHGALLFTAALAFAGPHRRRRVRSVRLCFARDTRPARVVRP